MNWKQRKQAAEQRAKVLADAKAIIDKAEEEKRDLSDDENTNLETLEQRAKTLGENIAKYDRLIALTAAGQPEPRSSGEQAGGPGREDINDDAAAGGRLGLTPKERRSYSILKIIRAQVEHRAIDGLERELSDEIARRSQKQPQGVFIPLDMVLGDQPGGYAPPERRDLTTTTGTGAVGTDTAATFIQLLRDRLLVNQLGATVMTGLVGDLSIPKQTGGATAYWVTEGNSPTESNQTVGQVGLSPNTVGAFTDMSRKFIRQSSADAEAFVRGDLAAVVARAIDAAVLNGSGSGAEPTGILKDSNVSTVAIGTNGGAPTFAFVVGLETKVSTNNAAMGNLAYVTSAKGRGKMKTTPKVSNQPIYLWETDNTVNGYPAHATNLMPDDLTKGTSSENCSALIFGNWNDVVIGMWSGLDILVDPYTGGNAGTVRINALQDVDIALRHTESFAKIVDMTTS